MIKGDAKGRGASMEIEQTFLLPQSMLLDWPS